MNGKKIGAFLLLLAGAAVALWWFTQRATSADKLTLYGNVEVRQLYLAFENSGRVLEINAEEGEQVRAGQVVARLDSQTYQLKLAQAEAQTEALQQSLRALQNGSRPAEIKRAELQTKAAQAEMERSQAYWQRLQNLARNGSGVSRQDLDNAQFQYQAALAQFESSRQSLELLQQGTREEEIARAQAQLKAAQAEQKLMQHYIQQAQLVVPQDARVRARLLEVGDIATPQRAVYTLALTQSKWIRAYVNEVELGHIKPHQAAQVFSDSAPEQPINGHIGYISEVAEFTPKTVQTSELRTALVYEIRIIVDDQQDRLRLGMPVTVQILPALNEEK